jgi:hypothetical protein
MIFGELVLSDSVVAYISHKFSTRYIVSLAHEWEEFRATQGRAKLGMIFIGSIISSTVILTIPPRLCLTSSVQNEDDWTLTQCPDMTWEIRGNTTNLLRIDDMFLNEDAHP